VQFDEWTMSLRKNPKIVSQPGSNTENPPEEWVSGSEPMTGAQASYLKTLSEQASEPEAFDATLTKAEASRRIDALKAKLAKELSSGVERPGVSFDPELQRDD
jgi:hypothetical protein